ncbi:MAG: efflux RND transporter periplasmic adaptor subunit, partial [Dehalococcoidales bacterium]
LPFQTAGFVNEVLVEAGDVVEKEQVLVSLYTTSLELEVEEMEAELGIAENDFRQITYPYTYRTLVFDVPASIADIRDAQRQLTEVQEVLEIGLSFDQYWDVWNNLKKAQDNLIEAKAYLTRGYGADVFSWAPAEANKGGTKPPFNTQIYPIEDYWELREMQLEVEIAQVDLDKANNDLAGAVIVAPFDGVITEVSVSHGKKVSSGTVAMQIADPDKFEVEVKVTETDIFQIKRGGRAWVQVDVLPGVSLPAKITQISPIATIESEVVNYTVTVEIESATDYQLREGLTVTVSLVLEERSDVLLVPNEAITHQGGETYVQVLTDGVIEPCLITTGISNYQYTEVTDGLSEGNQVIVP